MRLPNDIENLILNKCEPIEQVRLIHENIMDIHIVKNPYLIAMTAIEMFKSDVAIKLIQYHTKKWDIEYYQEFFEIALRHHKGNKPLLNILYPIIESSLPGAEFRLDGHIINWHILSTYVCMLGVGKMWEEENVLDDKSISLVDY